MSGVDIAGLVEELVRAVSLRCHSHPGEERRSATERASAAKQALLDALLAQAAELAEARAKSEAAIKEARHAVLSMLYMPGVRAALDNLPEDDPVEPYLEMARKGDEALAALKASEWQPIETAPKDGSRFLATGGGLGSHIDFASYNDRVGCWNTTEFTLDDTDHEPEGYHRPTLWMPLPPKPQSRLLEHADATNNPPSDPGTGQREAGNA